jgi:hypothetical protein
LILEFGKQSLPAWPLARPDGLATPLARLKEKPEIPENQGLPSPRGKSRLHPLFGKTLEGVGPDVADAEGNDDLWQLKFG